MTLETERQKDRSSSKDLGFIHLAKPPRHPKQSRRTTLKSLPQSDSVNACHHNQPLSARVLKKNIYSECSLSGASKFKLVKKDEKNIPAFVPSPLASFRRKSYNVSMPQGQDISAATPPKSFQFLESKRKLSLSEKFERCADEVFDKQFTPSQITEKQDKDLLLDLFFRSAQDSHSECKKVLTKEESTPSKGPPASKIKVAKCGLTSDNQNVPAIPPPPDVRGRSLSRVPQESVDLMDLSSEDEKSTTSSTQTLSTLQTIVSPTVATVSEHNAVTLASSPVSSTPSAQSQHNSAVSVSSTLHATSPSISTKLLQARMSLTGLSPPHLMSSEEYSKNANAFYTPLTTPDLKIDLLESDGRRQSMAEMFSPTLLPPGFPFITPEDLTPEELHEFHMKWGSPHHAKGRTGLIRPTLLTLPTNRPRVTSLPNRTEDRADDEEDEYYRLRHFSITGRGVVNRGDSFKSRRSKSNNSVASDVSSNEGWAWSHPGSVANSAASSAASSRASSASEGAFPFRVVMLGAAGVGKTTICHQFMSSEHINGYDSSLDDEYGEKSVSIMLDSEESELLLIDHPADEMSVENYLATYNPHAIIVVFSVVDRQSFVRAEEIIQYLWRLDVMSHKGVILVANKTDLVRNRCISVKESSNLADSYDCKFIETSSGLNHQVDELLVGVVKQIRLKIHNPDLSREVFRKRSCRRKKYRGTKTSASLKVKSLLTKVCGKEIKSKSCENLHVL